VDFRLDPEQQALRTAAGDVLRQHCPPQRVRQLWADGCRCDEVLWSELGQLEWFGMCAPERAGGMGLGLVELSLIAEQLGYASAVGPIVPTLAAGAVLGRAPRSDLVDTVLCELVAGKQRIAIGTQRQDPMVAGMDADRLRAQAHRNDLIISGTLPFAPWAKEADAILIPLTHPSGGAGMALVDSRAGGVSVTPLGNIDGGTDWGHVSFNDVVATSNAWLDVDPVWVSNVQAISAAAEILGACRRCLDISVEYAGIRHQFGRPIGSFQAVRHMCADMYVGIENLGSVVAYAAAALEAGTDSAGTFTAIAAIAASQVGTKVWTNALQVHGGVGFTWEYELHLHLKRIMALQGVLGSSDSHAERILASAIS
jgi:alkylation response protein AidB-like acyl-CoA dehydrogenase